MKTDDTQSDVREAFAELSKDASHGTDSASAGDDGGQSDAAGDSGVGAAADVAGAGGKAAAVQRPVSDSDGVGDDGGTTGASEASRARGPDGKFIKAESKTVEPKPAAPTQTVAPVAAPTQTQTAAPAQAVQTPTFKAPQSWKPEMREKFSSLPPELQAEISRTETEWQKFKGDSGTARRVHQAVAPFEAEFKAMGADVTQALPGILSTVKALAKGDTQTKARILGQMVTTYLGKDEAGLKALAMAIDTPEQAAAVDPVAIEQRILAQMQQRQEEASIQQALQEFGAEPREFLPDVETVFGAIIRQKRAMGESPSAKMLQEAYDQACWATPEVRAVLTQREASRAAKATQEAANKAKAAAVSVRPSHVVAPPADTASATTEDDVRAAFAELSSRVR